MRALVLEGGAMRGIFTAGVLDVFAERGEPPFDLIVGVSAGACCAASFLAGQHGRNRRIFVERMTTKAFADPLRMLRGGSLTDMAYLMGDVTFTLDPLDIGALRAAPSELESVATDAVTGEALYLPSQGDDCVDALHATVALPFFYKGGPIFFRDRPCFDGGVVDPIPVGRAVARGARHVTVVLTKPSSWSPKPLSTAETLLLASDGPMREYPGTFHAIRRRHEAYERTERLMSSPPPGVELKVLRPPEGFPVARFTSSLKALARGYEMGREAAKGP